MRPMDALTLRAFLWWLAIAVPSLAAWTLAARYARRRTGGTR